MYRVLIRDRMGTEEHVQVDWAVSGRAAEASVLMEKEQRTGRVWRCFGVLKQNIRTGRYE